MSDTAVSEESEIFDKIKLMMMNAMQNTYNIIGYRVYLSRVLLHLASLDVDALSAVEPPSLVQQLAIFHSRVRRLVAFSNWRIT